MTTTRQTSLNLFDFTSSQIAAIFVALDLIEIPFVWDQDERKLTVWGKPEVTIRTLDSILKDVRRDAAANA
jgi:hypothetical protein